MEQTRPNNKQMMDFVTLLSKFDAPSFLGLAKVLCVYAFDNNNLDENGKPTPRDGDEIIKDCIVAFSNLNRAKRREVITIMRRVVKNK